MNVIGKCTVELTIATGDGLSLQKQLQEGIEQRLFPRMEELFERIADREISISIDRLNVEIEIGLEADWINAMSEEILKKVESRIQFHISDNLQSSGGVVRSNSMSTIQKLTFFLHHGYLPWWCTDEESKLEEATILRILQSQETYEAEDIKRQIIGTLSDDKAVSRLVRQFPETIFNALIGFLFPAESSSIIRAIDVYKSFQAEKKLSELYNEQHLNGLRKEVLLAVLKSSHSINWKDYVREYAFREISGEMRLTKERKEDTLFEKEISIKEYSKPSVDLRGAESDQHSNSIIKKLFAVKEIGTDEEIFINNAGLVIISPFLPKLFEELRLTKAMQLQSLSRAVHLLHYLATGNQQGREYEMVLNKILCGLEVEESVERVEMLTMEEMEEADKLLLAVLQHWKVLKNTSKEGLRESFLMRNGKLTRKEDDWLLQVEQKSYDMLLESLPWSINLIHLPFMKTSIHVEWM